jgi:hypothetical protein
VPVVLAVLGWMCASVVYAQSIESILAPGPLIEGHIKLEGECKNCHVKLDRKAQSKLCTDCHKDVGADVRAKAGFHGRLEPQACNVCHTDHKGRQAQIVKLDERAFDHTQTDYRLLGKHQDVACKKCHQPDKKYRDAPTDCVSCHRKDDTHKGTLGTKCADCHVEKSWKEARFDHDLARFALKGKHVDVKCADCHTSKDYRDAPLDCIGCHKKDDDKKGHKGQFGDKCESCHTANDWKKNTFNHDTDTKYRLLAKHRNVECVECHKGHLYKVKLQQTCFSCHEKDDKHKGSLGKDCASCHVERGWKESVKFDHQTSNFPLFGKHDKAQCKDCHKSPVFKDAPKECIACHENDDKHKKNLGSQCADCHNEVDWKSTEGRFKHDKTRFKLRNAHAAAAVKCVDCHKDLQSYRNTPMDCDSCHKKDDKHERQLGVKCEQCHSDKTWKEARFDHDRSRFPLLGRHIVVACKDCHATPRYKDAERTCVGCHLKEDTHKEKFGQQCESCHNARAWRLWSFDHGTKTKFALDGAHAKVACETCHSQPAPKGKTAAPLAMTCVSCHAKADVHEGALGTRCAQCHGVENWKKLKIQFDRGAGKFGALDSRRDRTIRLRGGASWVS